MKATPGFEPLGAPAPAASAVKDRQRDAFAISVMRGLAERPRWLSCRYLYDRDGSEIFERITETPEYYPTRTEDGILARDSPRIAALCGRSTLVELGAGSATKTRRLLRAWTAATTPLRATARYVPVDISSSMLEATCSALRREFASLSVQPLAGSYERALPLLRRHSPLTLLFLGSSIGNFDEEETDEFLSLVARSLAPGDRALLGIDLVKDPATLEAAYNDAAGWSAAFTKNLFARMNRELGSDLDLDAIEHEARWNAACSRIDIHARFLRAQTLRLPDWQRDYRIEAGERILVEISRKFRETEMIEVAARHGFDFVESFTDPKRWFSLLLLRRAAPARPRADTLREALASELAAQRERTLAMLEPLTDAELATQHCPILSPVVWDLGHIAGYERDWIRRAKAAGDGSGSAGEDTGDGAGLFDPLRHPRAVRGSLPLPGPEASLRELERTRAGTLELLASCRFEQRDDRLLRDGYVFSMIAQHEAQHTETVLQGVQLLDRDCYRAPHRRDTPPGRDPAEREVCVPEGSFEMGSDDASVCYDNERPKHLVELPGFHIDVVPVRNGDYLGFVDDGGYRRRELWSSEGWLWLRDARVAHPMQWRRAADGSWLERSFGRERPLDPCRPVMHVSWYEAAACAAWLGKRLPSEAEWEKAACWDLERGVARRYPWGDAAPTEERANLGQRSFGPAAAGAYPRGRSYFGVEQMIGDVWEWTASDFLPYPGFRAWPYAEYSQVHFGPRHKVLRGGSWATAAVAVRGSFRNWDLPQRRQIFAGFRCARG